MPGARGRGMLPRRRRRDDEGEDESSIAGDLDDFSMSEGSAISNVDDEADAEGSEVSADDEETRVSRTDSKTSEAVGQSQTALDPGSKSYPSKSGAESTGAESRANGHQDGEAAATDKKDTGPEMASAGSDGGGGAIASAPQPSQLPETPAERARRDHQEYIKQRNSNPAFVPNRGGFFLHDDRTTAPSSSQHNFSQHSRSYARGRGRGYHAGHGIGRGYGQPPEGPTDRQWSHDLHDSINKTVASPPAKDVPTTFQIPTAKSANVAPNRVFSISTVLGNVTVQIKLPGMDEKKTFQSIVKKQHTLLPQHRPPLRRDKPVRISIPDEDPRYIFPSTERSFIFIPRAMRPNQQVYTRGRGRGSYQGSRRPSIMGSTYTPSVAMSRKSSLGGAAAAASTGVHTPTDGSMPRGPLLPNFNRPVVRMPVGPMAMSGVPTASVPLMMPPPASFPAEYHIPGPTILHSPPVALPMHQPRPQKTVSVAEIESPAVKGPQQQHEQPFHQQMPAGVSLADGSMAQPGQAPSGMAMSTPLSHIPEGAVYAQPFQPYPLYPPGAYYGPPFSGGPMVHHPSVDVYNMGMGGPVLPPQYPGSQTFLNAAPSGDAGAQLGAMAHEANGMVYYYDPSQFHADGSQMNQYPMTVGNNMVGMAAPAPYFYPPMPGGMFYPTAQ